MKLKRILLIFMLMAVMLLTGCSIRTVEQMYCLPKRSEAYANLQEQIDLVMVGLEYNAPISGEIRQTVQMVDLDGDGSSEYVLFAKGGSEKPLRIFIFSGDGETYRLVDTIESNGSAFDRVEYVQMDDRPGMEMILGRQVSDQVLCNLSVYTMASGEMEQLMSVNYAEFVTSDLDRDAAMELLVLHPGENAGDNGIAELYGMENGIMERSTQVNMSGTTDSIKRIMVSKLQDGLNAVYVASDVDGKAIITDVYAIKDGVFSNISFSHEAGTSVQTLRNYYVYADDIDEDGILELPNLINTKTPIDDEYQQDQYVIRWYAMDSNGKERDKMFTYHNFVGGWYIRLDRTLAYKVSVEQQGNSYVFSVYDDKLQEKQTLMTVFVLTGQKREEQAVMDNRFLLYRTETTVYAANLDVSSVSYGISRESLIGSFHLILQDWNTGET